MHDTPPVSSDLPGNARTDGDDSCRRGASTGFSRKINNNMCARRHADSNLKWFIKRKHGGPDGFLLYLISFSENFIAPRRVSAVSFFSREYSPRSSFVYRDETLFSTNIVKMRNVLPVAFNVIQKTTDGIDDDDDDVGGPAVKLHSNIVFECCWAAKNYFSKSFNNTLVYSYFDVSSCQPSL